jgi:hypothetical protein
MPSHFYIEYPADYHGFQYVTQLPESVARMWLETHDNYKRLKGTSKGSNYTIMNKGAMLVNQDAMGYTYWVYKHDFKYWLLSHSFAR